MNTLRNANKTAILLLLCCLIQGAYAGDMKTTLKRGIFNKQLTVKARGMGGACKVCLHLSITNNSSNNLTVAIDPGMIFTPEDTVYQNLVTWGDELVELAPSTTKEIDLFAFCGKSYGRCPRPNINYKFWKQGDSNMVKTLKHMKENNVDMHLAQSAVWVFTNWHCLSTVYRRNAPLASQRLMKYIADLKKIKQPEIYTELEQQTRADQPAVLANGTTKIYVPIKWSTEEARHMYVTVLKANGDVYKRIMGHEEIDKTGHTVFVEFNSVNDVKGTYYVELKDDNNKVWERKKVIVGYDPCQA